MPKLVHFECGKVCTNLRQVAECGDSRTAEHQLPSCPSLLALRSEIMGCVVSAPPHRPTIPPDIVTSMESNGPRRTERRLTMPASLRMTSRLRTSSLTWANTSHTRRSSATTGGSRRGSTTMGGDGTASRLYSFFAHRTSTGGRSTSAEPDKLDSLGLGSESNVVSAPSRWLVVLGERGAGKTTLIRQLKMSHDGLDAAEAARYSREVHKLAVTLFKQVVQGVHVHDASKTPEEHAAMERIKGLKRRATVSAEVADDVTFLWAKESIKAAVKTLDDAQLRKSVHHFATNVDRLCSPEFVPQELDLLHLAIPTIGQQETRINCFPGDQICVYETNSELRSSTSVFQGRSSVRKVRVSTGSACAKRSRTGCSSISCPSVPHRQNSLALVCAPCFSSHPQRASMSRSTRRKHRRTNAARTASRTKPRRLQRRASTECP